MTPIYPVPQSSEIKDDGWTMFFEQLRSWTNSPKFFSGPANPTTAQIPNGTWLVWKNTTTNTVRLWANNGGVLIGVTLT